MNTIPVSFFKLRDQILAKVYLKQLILPLCERNHAKFIAAWLTIKRKGHCKPHQQTEQSDKFKENVKAKTVMDDFLEYQSLVIKDDEQMET